MTRPGVHGTIRTSGNVHATKFYDFKERHRLLNFNRNERRCTKMRYFKTIWVQNVETEPVVLYYEVKDDRTFDRAVEVFPDGKLVYVDIATGYNMPICNEFAHTIEEMNDGKEFFTFETTKETFDRVFQRAVKARQSQ